MLTKSGPPLEASKSRSRVYKHQPLPSLSKVHQLTVMPSTAFLKTMRLTLRSSMRLLTFFGEDHTTGGARKSEWIATSLTLAITFPHTSYWNQYQRVGTGLDENERPSGIYGRNVEQTVNGQFVEGAPPRFPEKDFQRRVTRSGFSCIRVQGVHINSSFATGARGVLRRCLTQIGSITFLHNVDIVGGDLNATAYQLHRSQHRAPNCRGEYVIPASMHMIESFRSCYNQGKPLRDRMAVNYQTNTSAGYLLHRSGRSQSGRHHGSSLHFMEQICQTSANQGIL